jgi:hypothetical protein
MLKELSNSYVDVDFNFLKIILLLWPTQNIFLSTLHILWPIAIQTQAMQITFTIGHMALGVLIKTNCGFLYM